uniref:Uncharacterized protein n=1 Tax=Solanum lycopersicum TaxID=4081 RepID=K4BZU6_SOLLC
MGGRLVACMARARHMRGARVQWRV